MTRKRNHEALSSCSKRFKTNGFRPWLDLNADVLLSIMMQLGVIDFLAFSGVCKSWRSLAWANRQRFMAAKPPMLMRISTRGKKDKECCLEDYEGRKFKTILPYSSGRFFVGSTSGYLMFFLRKTREFWLVNPITRHKLYFPSSPSAFVVPGLYNGLPNITAAILVFPPSISAWVFVVLHSEVIWFCIHGDEGSWSCVSTTLYLKSLHVFNKKIYTISSNCAGALLIVRHVHELAFKPEPKLTLLETKNLLCKRLVYPTLVSWGKNLYAMENFSRCNTCELDFGEMEWVPFQDTRDGLAFFRTMSHANLTFGKPESWAVSPSRHEKFRVVDIGEHRKSYRVKYKWTWYFPNECLGDNLLDES